MVKRGNVVWAPDPFKGAADNPRPWLVISGEQMPYPDEESIAAALTTKSHHPGSVAVPTESWIRGQPHQESFVLPWTVATLKHELHVMGKQGDVNEEITEAVTNATITYMSGD